MQTDQKTVQAYAESMRNGIEFPPIDVFSDGQSGKYILADGFHRYTAYNSLRPNEPIKCFVYKGDVEDAQIFACGANAEHGLRRTCEDRRKAVKLILLEPQCQEWSNRRIADHVQVDRRTVGRIRTELEEAGTMRYLLRKRLGRDNKWYLLKTYPFTEPPEPDTKYRTNADGKIVNTKGFNFKAHIRCEACEHWDDKTGFCHLEECQMPSWTPSCSGYERRATGFEAYKPPSAMIIKIQPEQIPTRKHEPHALHIREKSVKCKLYPNNPQLSACEIRAEIGEEFLLALQRATTAITQEN